MERDIILFAHLARVNTALPKSGQEMLRVITNPAEYEAVLTATANNVQKFVEDLRLRAAEVSKDDDERALIVDQSRSL